MDRPIKKKKLTPSRIAWIVGTLIVLILLVYGFRSVGSGSTLRIDSNRLTISQVTIGEFQEFIPINGSVMPIKTFYLDATQGGVITEIFLEQGTFVNVGDEILRLDNTDLHLDIMYREAQLFEQINNLRNTRLAIEQNSLRLRADLLEINRMITNSKRDHEKNVGLYDKKLISKNEFEQTRDEYEYWLSRMELTQETQKQDSILRTIQLEQLEESVERMQANLEVVKRKLENLVLKAPIAGQLTSLDAEVGESKARGRRLGQIDVLEGFKIRADVDEYYIARINVGLEGKVEIAGQTYELTIKKVYPEVLNGRFQIDLEFEGNEPQGIRRGQTVQIRLALGDLSQATMLARGGFFHQTGGHWAYVLDESNEFATKREIKLGRQNPQVYEVLEGLEPGEKVIVSSYDNFEDFDRLVLKGD
jgi:HlyD family secretion protein